MGSDGILRRCVLDHECLYMLWECHHGVVGGHYGGKVTAWKILQDGLWCLAVFKDAKLYVKSCDVCQQIGKPSRRDDLPLHSVRELQPFNKWTVDFIGPIIQLSQHSRACYIITAIDYITRWEEVTPTKDCSTGIQQILTFWSTSLHGLATPRVWKVIRVTTFSVPLSQLSSSPHHPQDNGGSL